MNMLYTHTHTHTNGLGNLRKMREENSLVLSTNYVPRSVSVCHIHSFT